MIFPVSSPVSGLFFSSFVVFGLCFLCFFIIHYWYLKSTLMIAVCTDFWDSGQGKGPPLIHIPGVANVLRFG